MSKVLAGVAVGGALGSLCRYGLARWLTSQNPYPTFSVGILVANLVGCFLVGLLFARLETMDPVSKEFLSAFLITGFVGGLTTFSSYALELFRMGSEGAWKWAGFYFVVHFVFGLVAVGLGFATARMLA